MLLMSYQGEGEGVGNPRRSPTVSCLRNHSSVRRIPAMLVVSEANIRFPELLDICMF